MLELEPQFSPIALSLAWLCHGSAWLALFQVRLPLPLLLCLGCGILVSLWRTGGALLPGSSRRLKRLRLGLEDCLLVFPGLELRSGLPRIHYLGEFLLVLSFPLPAPAGGSHTLVLFPDSLAPPQDRRLRCLLRFRRQGAGLRVE